MHARVGGGKTDVFYKPVGKGKIRHAPAIVMTHHNSDVICPTLLRNTRVENSIRLRKRRTSYPAEDINGDTVW